MQSSLLKCWHFIDAYHDYFSCTICLLKLISIQYLNDHFIASNYYIIKFNQPSSAKSHILPTFFIGVRPRNLIVCKPKDGAHMKLCSFRGCHLPTAKMPYTDILYTCFFGAWVVWTTLCTIGRLGYINWSGILVS